MYPTFLKSNILSILILSLILSLLMSGCAAYAPAVQSVPQIMNGDVMGVQGGTARWIVEQALAGKAGAEVWFNGENYLFGAPIGPNYGFVQLNTQGTDPINICGGNIASCATWKGLVAYLAERGWHKLASLPADIVTYSMQFAGSLTTLMVVPYAPGLGPDYGGIAQ